MAVEIPMDIAYTINSFFTELSPLRQRPEEQRLQRRVQIEYNCQ